MIKIMFVCHGNICRSPMAEFIMKDLLKKEGIADVFVASAATSTEEIGNSVHYGTREILDHLNIDYSKKKAVQLKKSDYDYYDYLIGMDSRNINNMLRIVGGDPDHKINRLMDFTDEKCDIADPWYTDNFDLTYRQVLKGCKSLLEIIKEI